MPRDDVILWIDLETTGSSDEASIIEVGAILTDQTPKLKELGRFTTVIGPGWVAPNYEAAVVVEMHRKSGLTDALRDPLNPDKLEAEKMILRWINQTIGFSTDHIPWGGSGVGHFDAKYIRRDWEYLSKRLTYWVYDVGVIRRSLKLIGIQLAANTTEVKTHRALDDIVLHVEEMRQYLKYLANRLDPLELEEI